MTGLDVADLADPVWALIDAVANVNTYDAEIVDANGTPIDPPLDSDGRVHAYAVYYPSGGRSHSITLDAQPDSLGWSFQVTCVGGDRTRALWCVQQVRAALTGQWVTVAGQPVQILEEDGDPGPIRRDDTVSPPRHYLPLTFNVIA